VGYGTGKPRLSLTTKRAPIVDATTDDLQLIVGVETVPAKLGDRVPSVKYKDKVYRIWTEVESFTNLAPDAPAYIVDRISGVITFAPAIRTRQADGRLEENPTPLAAIPEAGKEIRVWYWCGGGSAGNVAAETLTTLKDAIPGISVTNHSRAA